MRRLLRLGPVVVAMAVWGCGDSGEENGGDRWEEDTSTFDVTWSDSATVIGEDQLDLLQQSDVENHTYTFDAAGVKQAGLDLATGRALVIHGKALREITSTSTSGGQLVVETGPATLTDAISDGVIAWDRGIDFKKDRVDAVLVQTLRPSGSGEARYIEHLLKHGPFKLTVGKYTYELEVDLEEKRMGFKFTVTKSLAGAAKGKFVAEGHLMRFRSKDEIRIKKGRLESFQHALERLKGEATLSLVVAASGKDAVDIKLPVTIVKVAWLVGPVPVELSIKLQFVINASVPVDGSSRVKAKFSYDSDLGLEFDGVDVESTASLGGHSIGKETTETGASTAIAANFGIGFPRIVLGLFNETGVVWAQPAFLIGGTFAPHKQLIPTCQTAEALILGAAGYKAKLGLFSTEGSKTFFEKKKELLRAGDCPPKE